MVIDKSIESLLNQDEFEMGSNGLTVVEDQEIPEDSSVMEMEDGGMLGYAVKEYVRGSSEFYDELGEVSQTLEKLKKDRPELFGLGNEIDLQLRNDGNYKTDGTDADPLRGELSPAGQRIHAAFHYEMASDSIKKAAARLQEEGSLDKDSALREAVKMHAEASAKLLDSISNKEKTP